MPSGASEGNARCTMALKEPLRSEPQIETMLKLAMRASKFFENIIRGIAAGLSRPHAQDLSIARCRRPRREAGRHGVSERRANALGTALLGTRLLGMSAEHRVISR